MSISSHRYPQTTRLSLLYAADLVADRGARHRQLTSSVRQTLVLVQRHRMLPSLSIQERSGFLTMAARRSSSPSFSDGFSTQHSSRLPTAYSCAATMTNPNQPSPNHALQRTAPCVTAPASAAAFPPTMQVPRRTPRSLSLGSLGDFAAAH